VLLLDKPSGISSNAALQRAKRALNAQKAGHTGTLDPLASGLLPLCFGEATKFAQVLLDARKRYTTTMRFGATTATGDAEGPVLATFPVAFSAAALHAAADSFVGARVQTPHAYSALKFEGRALYNYARAGVDVPRLPRPITIDAMRVLSWDPPDAVIDIECSKGTYVRVLAEELGHALGSGAHLIGLRRTGTGVFALDDAMSLAAFESMAEDAREAQLRPVDAPLAAMPRLSLDAPVAAALRRGQCPTMAVAAGLYRVYDVGDRFIGIAAVDSGIMKALRLMQEG